MLTFVLNLLKIEKDEANVSVSQNKGVDCIVSCKDVIFKNGKEKRLRLITFIDITKQKETERKLMDAQEEMIDMVEEYGLKTKETKPMLDLLGIEIRKCKESFELLHYSDKE